MADTIVIPIDNDECLDCNSVKLQAIADKIAEGNEIFREKFHSNKVTLKFVSTLPETGEENIIYFVAKEQQNSTDMYDEYVWYNGHWERISSVGVDLNDYYTKSQVDALLASYKEDVDKKLSDFITKDYVDSELSKKQDKLTAGTGIDILTNGTIQVQSSLYYTRNQVNGLLDDKQDLLTFDENFDFEDGMVTLNLDRDKILALMDGKVVSISLQGHDGTTQTTGVFAQRVNIGS